MINPLIEYKQLEVKANLSQIKRDKDYKQSVAYLLKQLGKVNGTFTDFWFKNKGLLSSEDFNIKTR